MDNTLEHGFRFTTKDAGCVADGAFGHAHVREVLAELLAVRDGHAELVAELQYDMSDNASEELEAIEILNSECSPLVNFELVEGSLMLVRVSGEPELWDIKS